MQAKSVDVLFEQHGARITDFRRGKPLGKRVLQVYWRNPHRPDWMSREQYEAFPEQLIGPAPISWTVFRLSL